MNLGAQLPAIGSVLLDASIDIIPYFLLALFLGSLLEEILPESAITRFLTGTRIGTMLGASTVGAIIPLCTCGMVPLAVSIQRRGSDLKHTLAFLTAGAAISLPVLLLTWKVLGLGWAMIRFSTAVLFGLVVGYASVAVLKPPAPEAAEARNGPMPPVRSRIASVLRRFRSQVREYGPWVLVSLVIAATVHVLVPRAVVQVLYGQRMFLGSLLASVTGLPFYFCSGAELPLVKELLQKGMGAGPASSMLLAVPVVNFLTLGVVARWLGVRGGVIYLILCAVGAALIGTGIDVLIVR